MGEWDRTAGPPKPSAAAVFLQLTAGILVVGLAHAVFLGAVWGLAALTQSMGPQVSNVTTTIASVSLMALAVVQVVYVLPMAFAAWFVRRPLAFGILIGAALTVLLQGGCYGLFALLLTAPH